MSGANGNGSMLGNLKFNTVGREEAAKEVLTPQIDPAIKMRYGAIIAVVVIAVVALLWMSYQRSRLDLNTRPQNNKQFVAPDHDIR